MIKLSNRKNIVILFLMLSLFLSAHFAIEGDYVLAHEQGSGGRHSSWEDDEAPGEVEDETNQKEEESSGVSSTNIATGVAIGLISAGGAALWSRKYMNYMKWRNYSHYSTKDAIERWKKGWHCINPNCSKSLVDSNHNCTLKVSIWKKIKWFFSPPANNFEHSGNCPHCKTENLFPYKEFFRESTPDQYGLSRPPEG